MKLPLVKGFSIVEVIVAMALMTIVAKGAMTVLDNYQLAQKNARFLNARNSIYNFVGTELMKKENIRLTLQVDTTGNNLKMLDCSAYNRPVCPSDVMGANEQKPINFYRAVGDVPNNVSASHNAVQRISGTLANPVRYNMDGKVDCSPATDPSCIFEVVTWFWAECYNAASCTEASLFYFRHQVRICSFNNNGACRDLSDLYKQKMILNNHPRDDIFNADKGQFSFPLLVNEVKFPEAYRCTDPNASLIASKETNEFSSAGAENKQRYTCQCARGFKKNGFHDGNKGDVRCVPMSDVEKSIFDECPNTTGDAAYVSKILPTGMVECARPRLVCNGNNGVGGYISDTTTFNCVNRGASWLVFFRAGQCSAGAGKKGGASELDCDPSFGRCCGWQ